jgi:acyl-coenzyme A thioesterase PaaI-like protein
VSGIAALGKRWLEDRQHSVRLEIAHTKEAAIAHYKNCEPSLFTCRLQQLVPLLKFVGAKVKEVSAERTVLTAPLLASARNQNNTQQASVFYILADYALGIALFAAVPWVYVIDVHDGCDCVPVQMWLLSGQVKHLAPGTGEITAVASLSTEQVDKARRDFYRKKRCRMRGTVEIYQGEKLVALAEHEVGMYAALTSMHDASSERAFS